MRVISLGLHITDECVSRCRHCAYGCGPDRRGAMELSDAKRYLKESKGQPIQSLCISGGEPFIYYDRVVKIMEEAKRLEIPEIWVFTNGYWAETVDIGVEKLLRLKNVGLTKIWLSADAFHQEYIPITNVKNVMQGARELDIKIALDIRYLGSPKLENSDNLYTKEIVAQLGNLEGIELYEGEPLYIGRAAKFLSQKVRQKSRIPRDRCEGIWAAGTLENPEGVDIDQYGEVTLCPGISIGNAKRTNLSQIIKHYSYRKHPIIAKIVEHGPYGLIDLVKNKEIIYSSRYANACHLCYEIRKMLHPYYPQFLAPKNCYE